MVRDQISVYLLQWARLKTWNLNSSSWASFFLFFFQTGEAHNINEYTEDQPKTVERVTATSTSLAQET